MEENTFWLRLWQSLIAGVCMVAFFVAAYFSHKMDKATELIAKGADPVQVACALDMGPAGSSYCLVISVRKPAN